MAADNLERIGQTWYASMHVPPDVRAVLGKSRLRKTLKTTDKRIALHNVRAVVDGWWAEIHRARKSLGVPLDPVTHEAIAYREAIQAARSEEEAETLESAASEFADKLAETRGDEAAGKFLGLATGRLTRLSSLAEKWSAQLTLAPKTKLMYTSDLERATARFHYLERVTPRAVREWLLALSEDVAPKTQGRILTACSNFWGWCESRNHVPEGTANPFKGHKLLNKAAPTGEAESKPGSRQSAPRKPFTAQEVADLWAKAIEKKDQPLADLIHFAAYTGARIEELCSVKVGDVAKDFGSFRIEDSKTKAGIREVPVHAELVELLKRMKADSKDGYLIPSTAKNTLGQRSAPLGKRFGHLKDAAGFGPGHVFHSIRKTVATLLENAGVAENVAADIVGHEKNTMTYGLYSGGASLSVKAEAIAKIAYPAKSFSRDR